MLCNDCSCKDCVNTPGNVDFIRAEQARALARNPLAFSVKVGQGLPSVIKEHARESLPWYQCQRI